MSRPQSSCDGRARSPVSNTPGSTSNIRLPSTLSCSLIAFCSARPCSPHPLQLLIQSQCSLPSQLSSVFPPFPSLAPSLNLHSPPPISTSPSLPSPQLPVLVSFPSLPSHLLDPSPRLYHQLSVTVSPHPLQSQTHHTPSPNLFLSLPVFWLLSPLNLNQLTSSSMLPRGVIQSTGERFSVSILSLTPAQSN